jgi:predicted nucleotidyltransferase
MGTVSIEDRERAGWDVIEAAVAAAEERLEDRLLSAYAIGSLAHGGFAPAVSDVDLALLTGEVDGNIADVIEEIRDEVAGTWELGARLSIFHAPWAEFGDPPEGARFPPIDRFDLVRYGILVGGTDLRGAHATLPSAREIRTHAVESALRRVTPEQLDADLGRLAAGGVSVHDATKTVLWPIRLQHVCDVGQATGNADAVAHYRSLPDVGHSAIARDALAWRDLSATPDPEDALARIDAELRDLHVEVFRRLGGRAEIPRRDELSERADRLEAAP